MIALIIVPVLIVLIALLRIRVFAEYGTDGVLVTVKLGFIRVWYYPRPQKKKKVIKKTVKKAKKAEKKPEDDTKKPGRLREFYNMLPALKKALSLVRRKLLLKKLTLYYTAAGGNAMVTALSFGAANAAVGVIVPLLENSFRIKKRDIRMNADFQVSEPYIYVSAAVSLAVWEAVYILLGAAVEYGKNQKGKKKYGKASDR